MAFGPVACAFLCGSLFLGAAQLMAVLVLSRGELRRAKSLEWPTLSLIAAVSLIALMGLGGAGHWTELGGWFVGAVVGGWAALELGFAARFRMS
jgi:hypothetical protein